MIKEIKKYRVRDWVLIAMTAAVLGVLFTFLDSLYTPLSNLLGPVFLGITYGVYRLSALLPSYLTRKPGAALVGSLFAGCINLLTGSPYGINIIVAAALQGLGAEIGFGIGKYKNYSIKYFFISAFFMELFVAIRDYFVFGLSQLSIPMLIATLVVRFLSTAIIGFALCYVTGKGLTKVGLVRYEQ